LLDFCSASGLPRPSHDQDHQGFGKIIKLLFILRIIDDIELRQAIERQLAKIEHAHRFTRAVSVGNPREFIQAEKQEQETAEG
jgi:TnpA family transposase